MTMHLEPTVYCIEILFKNFKIWMIKCFKQQFTYSSNVILRYDYLTSYY